MILQSERSKGTVPKDNLKLPVLSYILILCWFAEDEHNWSAIWLFVLFIVLFISMTNVL